MAVIVQHMVDAALAGVLFTQPGRLLVSATVGTGEHLMGGTADALVCDLPATGHAPPPYGDLAVLATTLSTAFAQDIDIEWAWVREGLQLLQVRPVTASVASDTPRGPIFSASSLYFSDSLPCEISLGECAELYLSITRKRVPLFRLATEFGFTVNDGWVLTLNGAGLASSAGAHWLGQLSGTLIVDIGTRIRQNILDAVELKDFLATTLNLGRDTTTTHTLLLRPFISGRSGAITQRLSDGTTVLEHSPDGLLAINRGLAAPSTLLLSATQLRSKEFPATISEPWSESVLIQMADFTAIFDADHPGACIEWVLHGQRPHVIDYSVPGMDRRIATSHGLTLSSGIAQGPLFVADATQYDTDLLTRLSIAPIVSITGNADVPEAHYIENLLDKISNVPGKPVIYAFRPYAILSRLINHAAGFIFQGGSPLCHLAILLREAGIPAAVVGGDMAIAPDQVDATIDNGAVYLQGV
jgi:rifampicin phosphotransferase